MICVTATLLVGWSDCPGNGQSDQLSGGGTRCVVVVLFCHENSFCSSSATGWSIGTDIKCDSTAWARVLQEVKKKKKRPGLNIAKLIKQLEKLNVNWTELTSLLSNFLLDEIIRDKKVGNEQDLPIVHLWWAKVLVKLNLLIICRNPTKTWF